MVVGISPEKREQRNKVNLVNKLIEETFGKDFSGDWFFDKGFERRDELNQIRKKGFGSFKKGNIPYAGQFHNQEGKSLSVFPDYYVSALKYAVLYKEATKEEVKIKLL